VFPLANGTNLAVIIIVYLFPALLLAEFYQMVLDSGEQSLWLHRPQCDPETVPVEMVPCLQSNIQQYDKI